MDFETDGVNSQAVGVDWSVRRYGVSVAVTSFRDRTIVAIFWRLDLADRCEPIARAFAKAYGVLGSDPSEGSGRGWAAIDFVVEGPEDRGLYCARSFMQATMGQAA